MNVASTISSARFSALLIEGENKSLGLESSLREKGCQVQRATTRAAAEQNLDAADIVIISSAGLAQDDVLALITRAAVTTPVVIAADDAQLAVKATKLGASAILNGPTELLSAQISQALSNVEQKRKFARQSTPAGSSVLNGVVQRRSTPLPKETMPEALDALIEAAEGLVPMHKFQRVYVDYALRRFGGNKVHTAAALGIDRRTIQRWARARSDQPVATTTNGQTTTTSN